MFIVCIVELRILLIEFVVGSSSKILIIRKIIFIFVEDISVYKLLDV